jgi:hypothetical protein
VLQTCHAVEIGLQQLLAECLIVQVVSLIVLHMVGHSNGWAGPAWLDG